jgi:hypothetical protein
MLNVDRLILLLSLESILILLIIAVLYYYFPRKEPKKQDDLYLYNVVKKKFVRNEIDEKPMAEVYY